tara:strand:- start:26425 stop:28605 length:2181 start_codon:yes stop_codon:yes gene_type:complete
MGRREGILLIMFFILVLAPLVLADNHTLNESNLTVFGDSDNNNSELASRLGDWLSGDSNFWEVFVGFFDGLFGFAGPEISTDEEEPEQTEEVPEDEQTNTSGEDPGESNESPTETTGEGPEEIPESSREVQPIEEQKDLSVLTQIIQTLGKGTLIDGGVSDCNFPVFDVRTCSRQEGVYEVEGERYFAFVEEYSQDISETEFRSAMTTLKESGESISLGHKWIKLHTKSYINAAGEEEFYSFWDGYEGYSYSDEKGIGFLWYSGDKVIGVSVENKKWIFERSTAYAYVSPNARYDPNKNFYNFATEYVDRHGMGNFNVRRVCIDEEKGKISREGLGRNLYFNGHVSSWKGDVKTQGEKDNCVQGDLSSIDPRFAKFEHLEYYRQECSGDNCGVNDYACAAGTGTAQSAILACPNGCSQGVCKCVADSECGFGAVCGDEGLCEVSGSPLWYWEKDLQIEGIQGDYEEIINEARNLNGELIHTSEDETFYNGCVFGLDLPGTCESYAGFYGRGGFNSEFFIGFQENSQDFTQEDLTNAVESLISREDSLIKYQIGYDYPLGPFGGHLLPYLLTGDDYTLMIWFASTPDKEIIILGARPVVGWGTGGNRAVVMDDTTGGTNIQTQILAAPYYQEYLSASSMPFRSFKTDNGDTTVKGYLELWRGNALLGNRSDICGKRTIFRGEDIFERIDPCLKDGCILIEFNSSKAPSVSSQDIHCPNGCSNGACII